MLDESRPDRGRLLMRAGEAGMGKMLLAEGALGEWLAASSGLIRLVERKRCWRRSRAR
ncbi:MAG: hypothetical protein WAK44_27310 [Trebonia sp.]|uniref:hypothetical protein n=1 Tax=Trebonia sp. TaxID=2767075 RepID=UPI003BAF9D46